MLQTFLLFVTVAMLSLYQSSANCRSRQVKNNFTHKVSYHWKLCFPVMSLSLSL